MKKNYNLYKIRKNAGFTLVDLAKRLGISKQYIWDLENGRKVLSYRMAFKIAKILNVKPDEIFLDYYKKEL